MLFKGPNRVETPLGTSRLSLGVVLQLEWIDRAYLEALNQKNVLKAVEAVLSFIEAGGLDYQNSYMVEVLESLFIIHEALDQIFKNLPPALQPVSKKKDTPPVPWEYPEMGYVSWIHQLAKNYHWDRETILNLDPLEAAWYIQEIKTDEVFDREWQYSLSELAYAYDKTSGKSRFIPLSRPEWMQPVKPVEVPIIKIPAKFLPVGHIVDLENYAKD